MPRWRKKGSLQANASSRSADHDHLWAHRPCNLTSNLAKAMVEWHNGIDIFARSFIASALAHKSLLEFLQEISCAMHEKQCCNEVCGCFLRFDGRFDGALYGKLHCVTYAQRDAIMDSQFYPFWSRIGVAVGTAETGSSSSNASS